MLSKTKCLISVIADIIIYYWAGPYIPRMIRKQAMAISGNHQKQAVLLAHWRSAPCSPLPQGLCTCWANSVWNSLPGDVSWLLIHMPHIYQVSAWMPPHQRGFCWPPNWKCHPSPPTTWHRYVSAYLLTASTFSTHCSLLLYPLSLSTSWNAGDVW